MRHGPTDDLTRRVVNAPGTPYTFMSDEAIEATINEFAASGETHYEIRFSPDDLTRLLWALRVAWDADAHESTTIGSPSPTDYFPDEDGSISEWAGSFASSIASTLGIEWV